MVLFHRSRQWIFPKKEIKTDTHVLVTRKIFDTRWCSCFTLLEIYFVYDCSFLFLEVRPTDTCERNTTMKCGVLEFALFMTLLGNSCYGVHAFISSSATKTMTKTFYVADKFNVQRALSKTPLLASLQDDDVDDDDDDGWGISSPGGSNDDTTASKMKELQALQQAQQEQKTASSSVQQQSSNTASPAERDLFIPIFAIVSLVGLFGAYGYEMVRLYSRGELYLPWN